ncbi:MAG: NAD(P)/FAD-dependent oxidoreductase [Rhodospirillales bacterium]|nr:NAD(P)/FAD-dependent oxidoreductase [Rhodospirillales bacterium]
MNRGEQGPSIIIIGAGFGGIALAIALKKAGIESFTILERANGVGGVWRDNRYPGAACDVVSRLYSYSFDRAHEWSTVFAQQAEILAYIEGCAERHDLMGHIRFGVEVAGAAFGEANARWRVATAAGEVLEAQILVSAVGIFNRPMIPDIPGRATFAGAQFHSARWDRDIALAGKTVAVVGTGASAVQFVPKLAASAARLHVFQRSPQYVLPKTTFPGNSPWDAWLQRHKGLRWLARLKIFLTFERMLFRRQFFPQLREKGEQGFRNFLAGKIADPELRRKLTPEYPLGCKRLLVSNEWYDTLMQPHVEVVDTPIDSIVPEGIRTRDGAIRRVDAIVYGTGFRLTESVSQMRITGSGGRDLNEAWRDGAEAYLGITVAGFPNFFMLYGPHTNAASSIVFMLECQAGYILRCIRAMRHAKARTMTVREPAQRRFIDAVQARLSRSVPAQDNCLTYFKTASGRITTQWPGYATEYRWRTRRVRTGDYEFG